jgi:hypothetical protein
MATEPSNVRAERTVFEREAIMAELSELVEIQAGKLMQLQAQIRNLRREKEECETELLIAQGWVRELAERVEEAEARRDERKSWTLASRLQAGR